MMASLGRRPFLIGGLATTGLAALAWGGSLGYCAIRAHETAMIRPLLVALADIRSPGRIGHAYLGSAGTDHIASTILARRDLVGVLLLPDARHRRASVAEIVREDFAKDDVVVADRWVVARTEAQLAAGWVAGISDALWSSNVAEVIRASRAT